MDNQNIYTVIITAITTLGGINAWRYFERRATHKESDSRWVKNDCQARIAKLELLLEKADEDKEELRALVLKLSTSVAKLQTQIAFLENTHNKKAPKKPTGDGIDAAANLENQRIHKDY